MINYFLRSLWSTLELERWNYVFVHRFWFSADSRTSCYRFYRATCHATPLFQQLCDDICAPVGTIIKNVKKKTPWIISSRRLFTNFIPFQYHRVSRCTRKFLFGLHLLHVTLLYFPCYLSFVITCQRYFIYYLLQCQLYKYHFQRSTRKLIVLKFVFAVIRLFIAKFSPWLRVWRVFFFFF